MFLLAQMLQSILGKEITNMSDVELENNTKNHRTLVAIIVVAALPVILAYVAYFTGWGVPDNTVNAGQILSRPIHVKELFAKDDSALLEAISSNKKWRILLPIFENCDEICQKNLYTTRQVHIRLSEKGARLERYALNLGGEKGRAYLESIKSEYPYLKVQDANYLRWFQWIDSAQSGLSNLNQHFYFLMDQEGYAMMLYTDQQHGNELLKDLKRALKYSIDYQ